MAFCSKCGVEIPDGTLCSKCQEPMSESQQNTQPNDLTAKIQNLNNTSDRTSDFEKKDIEENKVMAIFSYISWLVLIPIFAAPKSKFARFHANQGLVLAISEVIWWVAQGIITSILYAISWRLGFIAAILGIANIVFLIMAIIGIINAANGKAKELPLIGRFKILK